MSKAEEAALEGRLAEVRKKLAREEAEWYIGRLILAFIEFPEFSHQSFFYLFKDDFQSLWQAFHDEQKKKDADMAGLRAENDSLKQALQEVHARFGKVKQFVADLVRLNKLKTPEVKK
jgi:hypothetical protein